MAGCSGQRATRFLRGYWLDYRYGNDGAADPARGILMTWGKLWGLFSLKALLLACFLTPVTTTTVGITAAHAQIQIFIPGLNFRVHGGRRYGRSRGYYRSARRHGRRGGQPQQQQAAPAAVAPSTSTASSPAPVSSSRGYKTSTD